MNLQDVSRVNKVIAVRKALDEFKAKIEKDKENGLTFFIRRAGTKEVCLSFQIDASQQDTLLDEFGTNFFDEFIEFIDNQQKKINRVVRKSGVKE